MIFMTKQHDTNLPRKRGGEPVQVYLDRAERARLESLAARLSLTKSAVLRRGLESLELQLHDPDQPRALRILGLADEHPAVEKYDVAREHDRFLAESEIASW